VSTPEALTPEFLPADAPASALDPSSGLAAMLGMLGGGGGNPLGQLQSQLGALAANNPQLGSLLQMLQQRGAQPAQSSASFDEEPEAPSTPQGPALADVQALMDHANSLEAEVDALRGRNDALAAALGACHLCFGDDRGCEVCHGTGLPGWRPPEGNAFRRYVLPALRRVRAAQARASVAPANSFPASRCAGPRSFNGTEGPMKRRGLEQGAPRVP
jgi:hypothetical protein